MPASRCRARPLSLAILPLLAIASCSEPAATWQPLADGPVAPTQLAQFDRAKAARDALAQRLLGALTAAIGREGPAAAIDVCRQQAPQLAAEVGQQHGVRIGRTSRALRNQRNAPPAWAADYVATPMALPRLYRGPADSLGALLPITLLPTCLVCHGAPEQLAPGVAEALRTHYPNDRATGYRDGEHRGWFWVEVPSAP